MNIIDGKKLAQEREKKLRQKIAKLKIKKTPMVISILVGDDAPSHQYTNMKQKKGAQLGIDFQPRHLKENTTYQELKGYINKLNQDNNVDGIMVQLPLPQKYFSKEDTKNLLQLISPKKDIDGLTNKGKFLPAVVRAVIEILEDENITVKNKKVVVLGASDLIGKPVAYLLEKKGGIITVVNSKTVNPKELTKQADIVIAATGKPQILKGDMVKDGAIIIDVGAVKVGDKIVGDVDFETVSKKAGKITPVPGGVGPMTVICLMENIISKWEK